MPAGHSTRTLVCQLVLPIPQFPMPFVSMDLLGPCIEMEKRNQYALTFICMLTNYVYMVPIRTETTEDIIIAF